MHFACWRKLPRVCLPARSVGTQFFPPIQYLSVHVQSALICDAHRWQFIALEPEVGQEPRHTAGESPDRAHQNKFRSVLHRKFRRVLRRTLRPAAQEASTGAANEVSTSAAHKLSTRTGLNGTYVTPCRFVTQDLHAKPRSTGR